MHLQYQHALHLPPTCGLLINVLSIVNPRVSSIKKSSYTSYFPSYFFTFLLWLTFFKKPQECHSSPPISPFRFGRHCWWWCWCCCFLVRWESLDICWCSFQLTHLFPFFSLAANAFPYPAAGAVSSGSSTRPRLKEFQFGSSLIDGKSVRVFCHLSDGTGPVSFKWLKDGTPLSTSSSSHISIANFADYSSLAINRVDRRRDNGNYTCLAHNSAGTDQYSSLLNVQG